MTISGYPIGSDEDMAYHRATGEQVPKLKAEGLATAVDSVAENIGKAYLDIETRTSNYPLFEGYPRFEDTDWYRTGRIHDSRYFIPTRLSAVTDKNAKRVAKDRARNKAARKQRQQRRK